MKTRAALILAVALLAGALVHALMQSPSTQETPMHLVNSFDIEVPLPYAQAAPLFGPEGERAWAGYDWSPVFIHPQPAHDEEGAVFTVRHGHGDAVWVNTAFDVPGRHFQYVYFIADALVTTIDVRFDAADSGTTKAHVTYARTALKAEANRQVEEMAEGDKTAGAEWQAAIDKYVAGLSKR